MFLFSIRHVLRLSSDLYRHSLIALLGGFGTALVNSLPPQLYPLLPCLSGLSDHLAKSCSIHLCRPTSTGSLEGRIGKAGLGWVGILNAATDIPDVMFYYSLPTQNGREIPLDLLVVIDKNER